MADNPGLGTDLKLDSNGNFIISGTGDLTVFQGTGVLTQGIVHRLITPQAGLFYDLAYGLDLSEFVHRDNTALEQLDFIRIVKDQLNQEPRVRTGTGSCRVLAWGSDSVDFEISYVDIEGTRPENLVLNANMEDMTIIIKGVTGV